MTNFTTTDEQNKLIIDIATEWDAFSEAPLTDESRQTVTASLTSKIVQLKRTHPHYDETKFDLLYLTEDEVWEAEHAGISIDINEAGNPADCIRNLVWAWYSWTEARTIGSLAHAYSEVSDAVSDLSTYSPNYDYNYGIFADEPVGELV